MLRPDCFISPNTNIRARYLNRSPPGNGWIGISAEIYPGATETVTIRGNQFADLTTAIDLKRVPYSENEASGTVNFTLKCNEFINSPQTTTNFTRKGLVIGEKVLLRAPNNLAGTSFLGDQIGGLAAINANGTAYPNANVWPTATPRDTPRETIPGGEEADLHDEGLGWQDAPKWVPIENNSGVVISYYRYDNEFVKNNSPVPNPIVLLYPTGPKKVITGLTNPDQNVYDLACENFDDVNIILFPARVAVISGLAENTVQQKRLFLSDPIPNPAQNETRVQINLPDKSERPLLQMIDLGTGRVLQNIALKEVGQQEVIFDLTSIPSGVYSYRLFVDGIPSGTKKLIVAK